MQEQPCELSPRHGDAPFRSGFTRVVGILSRIEVLVMGEVHLSVPFDRQYQQGISGKKIR